MTAASSSGAASIANAPREQLVICPGPVALPIVRRFASELVDAQILPFSGDQPPALDGPAILVLCADDLRGPHKDVLLKLAEAAAPGRPVLFGGTDDRDLLLDAINRWRVSRIVPDTPEANLLVDAIRKAQQALDLERGLQQAATALRQETESLESALTSLRETEERTRQNERLATLGRITSSLIPVIGTHLDALQEFNSLVLGSRDGRDPRLEELLGYAFTGIRSLHAMLDEIRAYAESRPDTYKFAVHEVDEIAHFVVAFCRYDPLSARRRVASDLGADAKVSADVFRLYQSLINIIRNAYQASRDGGQVLVRTRREGDDVIIDVENDGEPIAPEVKSRLFEPFFTTKGEEGIGLGLSMCRTTIERHGGTISCTSGPGQPTRFRIRLPRLPD